MVSAVLKNPNILAVVAILRHYLVVVAVVVAVAVEYIRKAVTKRKEFKRT